MTNAPQGEALPPNQSIHERLDQFETLIKETLAYLVKDRQVEKEWFSIGEAAILTGLSQDHVRRSILGGTLPASNMGTPDRPLYRIHRKDIDGWMEQRKAGPI